MIAALALAAALTLTAPVDDVQLPMCAPGEEAVPFEDGYACGPADPVLPEPMLPEPMPTFTAEPAPVPAEPQPTTEPAPVVDAPSPAPAVPELPRLAETGVVEDRLLSLASAGIGIVAIGLGVVLAARLRRLSRHVHELDLRNATKSLHDGPRFEALSLPGIPGETYPGMRDKNGYYTKLKPTDPGYPYGTPDGPAGSSSEQSGDHPLSIREELRNRHGSLLPVAPTDPGYPYGASTSESEDEALDALGLPTIPGQTSSPVRVDMPSHRVNGLPKKIQLSSQAAKRRRLGPGESENRELLLSPDGEVDDVVSSTHDASPSVLDVEVAPSSSSDQTVGETADTAAMGSSLPFGSQRTAGGSGAASSGPAAPHSDLEGEQQ